MSNESKSRAVPEENKMGVMPVGRLLFSMSLPMMLSMLVQALYNIVDSIFVAKLSEDALSAVSASDVNFCGWRRYLCRCECSFVKGVGRKGF